MFTQYEELALLLIVARYLPKFIVATYRNINILVRHLPKYVFPRR